MEIRRILLAVDPSQDGGTALRTAAALSAALRAELEALFIEDINLLRLARLPFVRELHSVSASQRPLALHAMEQALRLQAERMRALLAQQAGAAGVAWSFSIARGSVTAELSSRSVNADLLIVSSLGAAIPGASERDPSLQNLLARSQCAVLLARGALLSGRPLVAVYEGGVRGAKVLDLALRLAVDDPQAVIVLVPMQQREALETEVRNRCAAADVAVQVRGVELRDPAAMAKVARAIGGRIWLLAVNDEPGAQTPLPGVRCPVLLVR